MDSGEIDPGVLEHLINTLIFFVDAYFMRPHGCCRLPGGDDDTARFTQGKLATVAFAYDTGSAEAGQRREPGPLLSFKICFDSPYDFFVEVSACIDRVLSCSAQLFFSQTYIVLGFAYFRDQCPDARAGKTLVCAHDDLSEKPLCQTPLLGARSVGQRVPIEVSSTIDSRLKMCKPELFSWGWYIK